MPVERFKSDYDAYFICSCTSKIYEYFNPLCSPGGVMEKNLHKFVLTNEEFVLFREHE